MEEQLWISCGSDMDAHVAVVQSIEGTIEVRFWIFTDGLVFHGLDDPNYLVYRSVVSVVKPNAFSDGAFAGPVLLKWTCHTPC